MSKEKTSIGPWLFLSILVIPTMSYGLMNAPHYGVRVMGANGYLGFLVAACLTLPGIGAIYLLAKLFPGKSIIEQGKYILSPVLGFLTGSIYLFFNLFAVAMYTRDIANLVGTYFLDQTPILALAFIFILVAAYAASRGIETISRWTCFVMIPALIVVLGLTLLGFQNFQWTHILPLASPRWGDYIYGGLSTFDVYYLIGVSAMSLPFLNRKTDYPRLAGGAIIFIMLFFTVYSIGAVGNFGHQYVLRLAWPGLEFVRDIDLPYLLIEQAGLLMLIVWVTMIIVGTGYLYYIVGLGWSQLTGALDYKRWVWILLPVIVLMITLPQGVIASKMAFDFIISIGWIIIISYPILLWLIAILFKRRRSNVDQA